MAPKKVATTWVLVADGTRACVLANDGAGHGLHEALPMDFVGTNLPTRSHITDRPGRTRNVKTSRGGSHAMCGPDDAHRLEKAVFAREVARRLDAYARAGAFDRLILVAPPRTLGDLRAALDPQTQRLVVDTIAKDLTRHRPAAVAAQLRRFRAV